MNLHYNLSETNGEISLDIKINDINLNESFNIINAIKNYNNPQTEGLLGKFDKIILPNYINGHKLQAVKDIKDNFGLSLMEAKDIVTEAWKRFEDLGIPPKK